MAMPRVKNTGGEKRRKQMRKNIKSEKYNAKNHHDCEMTTIATTSAFYATAGFKDGIGRMDEIKLQRGIYDRWGIAGNLNLIFGPNELYQK